MHSTALTMKKRSKKISTQRSLKKVKKRAIRLFVTIGVLTTSAIFVYGVWQMRDVFNPVTTQAGTLNAVYEIQPLDQEAYSLITLNLNSENEVTSAHVLNIDTIERSIRECIIPENVLLSLPMGLEEYPLRSLFKISSLTTENESKSIEVIRHSIHQLLGTSTDYFLITKNLTEMNTATEWLGTWNTISTIGFNNQYTKEHIETNLTKASLLKIAWDIQKTKHYSNKTLTLQEPEYGEIIPQKDGSKYLQVNKLKLDNISKQYFEDLRIKNENARITIVNSTKMQGLAAYVARILGNAGAHIVETTSSDQLLENSKVYFKTDDWRDSYTQTKLHHTIPVIKNEEYTLTDPRSDIKIVLGEDFAKFIKGE